MYCSAVDDCEYTVMDTCYGIGELPFEYRYLAVPSPEIRVVHWPLSAKDYLLFELL